MPAFGAAIARRRPQSKSGPVVTIRAESVSNSEIIIVNPLKKLLYVLKMWNFEFIHVLVNDRFTFGALSGNFIPEHYAVVEP